MAFTSPEQQRSLLALSFEPSDGGYIYYHNRWSRGVPVTAAEREAYLNIPVMGSRRAWRRSVANRQTVPPRAYRPVRNKLLAAMPVHMGLLALVFGVVGVLSGLAKPNAALAALYIAGGIVLCAFGASIILACITGRAEVR